MSAISRGFEGGMKGSGAKSRFAYGISEGVSGAEGGGGRLRRVGVCGAILLSWKRVAVGMDALGWEMM